MHILFALLLFPLMGLAGLALDVTRVYSVRANMLDALDAGTLAGAIHYKRTGKVEEAKTVMAKYYGVNFHSIVKTPVTFTVTEADSKTGKFSASAHQDVPTYFMPLFNIKSLPANAVSEATATGMQLEMSVVMDTTGSMAGAKLSDLKKAGNDLLDIFEKYMMRDIARLALVPFADAVNLGADASKFSEWQAGNVGATRKQKTTTGVTATFKRTNCVTETGANYTVDGNCAPPNALTTLTTNTAGLRTSINGLVAKGSTAGHLGTMWGGKMLDPARSLYTGPKSGLMRVAIIMTDGEYNTQYCKGIKDQNSALVEDFELKANCAAAKSSTAQAADACKAMKDSGVEVYVIGFQVQTAQKTPLTACATDDKHAYFPYSGASLRDSFQAIGYAVEAGLTAARVTQ